MAAEPLVGLVSTSGSAAAFSRSYFNGVDLSETITPIEISLDSDDDGLLDSWELEFFDDLSSTDGSGNADGDVNTDTEKFIAGISPVDPASDFTISSLVQAGDDMLEISWQSILGKSYRITNSGDLQNPWSQIGSTYTGTGNLITEEIAPIGARRFYRLEIVTE